VADENPSGLGAFEFPLRFPGQYADKETMLNYAHFRDCYDPGLGRFCQPDPAGAVLFGYLAAGNLGALALIQSDLLGLLYSEQPRYTNPFAYADLRPTGNADPSGLLVPNGSASSFVSQAFSGSETSESRSGSSNACFTCRNTGKESLGSHIYMCIYTCPNGRQYRRPPVMGSCERFTTAPSGI
jgi:RHS repeat-associated protein